MPWNQIINMNCKPPRPIAPRNDHLNLYDCEDDQQGQTPAEHLQHEGVPPAGEGTAVGLDPVGGAGEDHGQAGGEGEVAEPVDLGLDADADLLQPQVCPYRPENPDRDVRQENPAPAHFRK
jgi:hypothetical protein